MDIHIFIMAGDNFIPPFSKINYNIAIIIKKFFKIKKTEVKRGEFFTSAIFWTK